MHGDQGYLLFPWAEGSLKDYWKEAQRDPSDPSDITWFFEQCYGLALGLRRLHNPRSYEKSQSFGLGLRPSKVTGICQIEPDDNEQIVATLRHLAINPAAAEDADEDEKFGRHTDVKPENILWYRRYAEEDNHLVLSDFGSAQFSSKQTRSNVSPGVAGQKGTTETYQAPELAFGSTVTRRYDIWSLGCVFLEFAVWFHQRGWQAVEEFTEQRIHDRDEAEDPGFKSIFSEDMFYLVQPNGTARGEYCRGIKPSVKAVSKFARVDETGLADEYDV
jgi:serine/threonine protein kinase